MAIISAWRTAIGYEDVTTVGIHPSLRDFVFDSLGLKRHFSSGALPIDWLEAKQFIGPAEMGMLYSASRAHQALFWIAIMDDSWLNP